MTLAVPSDAVIDRQLKALADPTRRRIIELLKQKGCCSCAEVSAFDPGLCVCDLESAVSLSQPTITHHIRVLREAGLITTWKIGRWLYCRRKEETLDRLGEWLQRV